MAFGIASDATRLILQSALSLLFGLSQIAHVDDEHVPGRGHDGAIDAE